MPYNRGGGFGERQCFDLSFNHMHGLDGGFRHSWPRRPAAGSFLWDRARPTSTFAGHLHSLIDKRQFPEPLDGATDKVFFRARPTFL